MAKSSVADAIFTVVPKLDSGATKSIEKQLSSVDTKRSGLDIGKGLGKSIVGGIAALGLGQAIGSTVGKAFSGYGEYEQLAGGVETLFRESSDAVMSYSENAYRTAGLSANQYMETATGFAASLVSSLGGDTAAAAFYADTAISDMADNANKMGTSMDSIQNAYAGFSKQNYTINHLMSAA